MTGAPPPDEPGQARPDAADLIDYAKLGDWAGFVVRAVGRHKLLAPAVAALVVGGTAGLLALLPRAYVCESSLLAQRNQTIASLGNPGRSLGWDDAPLRAATETVMRHDNLVSIIQRTDAVRRWPLNRSPLLHWKDLLWAALGRSPTVQSLTESLTGLLGTRLQVKVGEGTIGFEVEWNDDVEMSCRLVEAAQQSFLEGRQTAEISTTSDAISLLEARALPIRARIETTVDKIEVLRAAHPNARRKVVRRPPASDRSAEAEAKELADIEAAIEDKLRAIAEQEALHRRQVEDLQTRLAEQRSFYSEAHPAVVEVKQRLEAIAREEPPQIGALRAQARELEQELRRRTGDPQPAALAGLAPRLGPLDARVVRAQRTSLEDDDPEIEQLRSDLRYDMARYLVLLDRIDAARMERETSRAEFKYRYTLLVPAELPKEAVKPDRAKVLGVSVLLALIFATVAAALADLRSGRIRDPWQVRRQLDLPILGELR